MPGPDESVPDRPQAPQPKATPSVAEPAVAEPGAEFNQETLQAIRRLVAANPEAVSMFSAAFSASAYSGPLPSPEHLREYEDVLPGPADRILKMAEKQSDHRQEIEKVAVKGGNSRSWWGLWLGFAISVLVLGLSAGLVLAGYQVAGTVLGSVDLVALASVFVIGRADQRKERVAKDQVTHTALPAPPGPNARRQSN
jgi:uncharacterized membrane protein